MVGLAALGDLTHARHVLTTCATFEIDPFVNFTEIDEISSVPFFSPFSGNHSF